MPSRLEFANWRCSTCSLAVPPTPTNNELPVSLLFQTGYLTIKQQKTDDDDEQCLVLEIPNAEVKESLMSELWASFYETSIETACKRIGLLATLLKKDNFIEFLREFNDDLASIPYNESRELRGLLPFTCPYVSALY